MSAPSLHGHIIQLVWSIHVFRLNLQILTKIYTETLFQTLDPLSPIHLRSAIDIMYIDPLGDDSQWGVETKAFNTIENSSMY